MNLREPQGLCGIGDTCFGDKIDGTESVTVRLRTCIPFRELIFYPPYMFLREPAAPLRFIIIGREEPVALVMRDFEANGPWSDIIDEAL